MEQTPRPTHFRDKVKAEAKAQKELRAAGQPIPKQLKKYARLSGLVMMIAPTFGLFVLYVIARSSGTTSVGVTLFFSLFILVGLAQLISGRHFLARYRT